MTDLRKAAQQALEALRYINQYSLAPHNISLPGEIDTAVDALRAALAQPEPFNPDWDRVAALEESLREHMAEIHRFKALAQPIISPEIKGNKAEPVAWASKRALVRIKDFDSTIYANGGFDDAVPLYTAPPQRKPLTVDQIYEVLGYGARAQYSSLPQYAIKCVRAIEKAHGIGS